MPELLAVEIPEIVRAADAPRYPKLLKSIAVKIRLLSALMTPEFSRLATFAVS